MLTRMPKASAIAAFTCSVKSADSGVIAVNHLDVVCFVLRHELIAGDAMQHGVHDGPFLRRRFPPALSFFARQFDGGTAADIHREHFFVEINARPNDFTGSRNSTKRASATRKIHGWLAKALRRPSSHRRNEPAGPNR